MNVLIHWNTYVLSFNFFVAWPSSWWCYLYVFTMCRFLWNYIDKIWLHYTLTEEKKFASYVMSKVWIFYTKFKTILVFNLNQAVYPICMTIDTWRQLQRFCNLYDSDMTSDIEWFRICLSKENKFIEILTACSKLSDKTSDIFLMHVS